MEEAFMKVEKLEGYCRIYQAESFQKDFRDTFGKNRGETARHREWLARMLYVLDMDGRKAIVRPQFEQLVNTGKPMLFSMRHPHSGSNERYLYAFESDEQIKADENIILLTVFLEKSGKEYKQFMARAGRVFRELDWSDDNER
jgi:hypothetical protein